MKYYAFFAGLVLVVPAGSFVAAYSRRIRELIFAVMIFSTAYVGVADINFISREWYHAQTRGIEVSFVDLLALTLLLGNLLSISKERFRLFWPSGLGLMLVFIAYALLSVATSEPKLFGVLELSKLLRGLLVFMATAWHVRSERDIYILASALGAVLVCEGLLALVSRYVWGVWRVVGTFPDPNILAEYCSLACAFLLVMTLSNARPGVRGFWGVAWVLGAIAVILSISRTGFVILAVGTAGALLSGLRTRITLSKIGVVLCFVALGSVMLMRSWDQFSSRHEIMTAIEAQGDGSAGRIMYYEMAWTIAKEQPFGVGLNNWSWWVSINGERFPEHHDVVPYASTKEEGEGTHAIFPHTLYGQTLGELGWAGLILLVALWCQWLFIAGRNLFVQPPGLLSFAGSGVFFALTTVALSALATNDFRSEYIFIIANVLIGVSAAARNLQKVQANTVRNDVAWNNEGGSGSGSWNQRRVQKCSI